MQINAVGVNAWYVVIWIQNADMKEVLKNPLWLWRNVSFIYNLAVFRLLHSRVTRAVLMALCVILVNSPPVVRDNSVKASAGMCTVSGCLKLHREPLSNVLIYVSLMSLNNPQTRRSHQSGCSFVRNSPKVFLMASPHFLLLSTLRYFSSRSANCCIPGKKARSQKTRARTDTRISSPVSLTATCHFLPLQLPVERMTQIDSKRR